ncbi:MAG: fused DSP-PTPase phosphatase/NAD kinase-like protein [Gemmataceae bacterium]
MKSLGTLVGILLVLAGFAAPVAVGLRGQRATRHFAAVRPGVLYRSAQLPPDGLKRLVHDYGIRTVVCIRDESEAVAAERDWCARNEVEFVRMPARNWDGTPGAARIDANLRAFLGLVRDPARQPVLVHCFAGVHRTGGYVAVYRIDAEGWDNADAVEEMRAMGYADIDTDLDIRQYLGSFRPGVLGTRTARR